MRDLQSEIKELETKNQQLKDKILLIEQANEALIRDKKSLKTYLKENKLLMNGYVRQGLRYLDVYEPVWATHYYVLQIEGIPLTLNILDVQELILKSINKDLDNGGMFEGYKLVNFNYSGRSQCWYVQIEKVIDTKIVY